MAASAAKISAPTEVVEGDRYELRIRVKGASKYKRADIQQRVQDIYGDLIWDSVKSLAVRNRGTLTHKAVAGESDRETFRVVLTPRSGKPATSKSVSVAVWHWYPVTDFDDYYSTDGVIEYAGNQFSMSGRSYNSSWYTLGTAKSWESRYTLGRNCRSMSGTFCVTDKSSDGSSASIQILAEGVTPVYASPVLTPGSVDVATAPLAMPYRISIVGTNTSPEKVYSYPAVGDLRFLCTGLA